MPAAFAFNQGNWSNKAGEQKHVTICHMPLGHKLSSRYTLGCVRPGGSAAAASLRQVPSCPVGPATQMSPVSVWDDLTCDPPIWVHWEGCLASITLRKESDDLRAHLGIEIPLESPNVGVLEMHCILQLQTWTLSSSHSSTLTPSRGIQLPPQVKST